MPQLGIFKAWIEVDAVALEEFQVEVDKGERTVRCYVPSEAGKEFFVHWSWEGNCASLGHLTLDGFRLPTSVHSGAKESSCFIADMELPDDHSLAANLKFGNIILSDDESTSLQDERLVKALGSIELEVVTGHLKPMPKAIRHWRVDPSEEGLAVPQQKPIYERMKKAGCHQVVPGADVQPISVSTHLFERDDVEPTRFIFVYRSRNILLAQGIIPHPVAPIINVTTNDVIAKEEEEDEAVDDEEDDRRLHALEEQKAAIQKQEEAIKRRRKRKSDGGERGVLKRMKVEEIDARAAFRPGEVIDLCDD